MAKCPSPGRTKTRLTPELTPQEAADLYAAMLADTIAMLTHRDDCDVILAVDEPSSMSYFEKLAPELETIAQGPGLLGQRLDTVLSAGLDAGYPSMFAINSDGPDLPPDHLTAAFAALEGDDTDVVLGPTKDGGYYLIGWKQRWAPMVRDVTMSTPDVFEDTMLIAQHLGATVYIAPEWHDVDVAADLPRLATSLAGTTNQTATFLTDRLRHRS